LDHDILPDVVVHTMDTLGFLPKSIDGVLMNIDGVLMSERMSLVEKDVSTVIGSS
jgi:hypothetical protein